MATGCALNAGLTLLQTLGIGGGGTAYSNANARIGVGDDDTGPNPAQTGLIGGTTAYDAMDATFPVSPVLLRTLEFQATFAAAAFGGTIKEVVVDNGGGGTALLRIVLALAEQFAPGVADIVRVNVKLAAA